MLIKTIAGIALFALLGAAIGYSKILCPDGGCAITGTSFGGAAFGGVLGLAVMSGLNNRVETKTPEREDDTDSQD